MLGKHAAGARQAQKRDDYLHGRLDRRPRFVVRRRRLFQRGNGRRGEAQRRQGMKPHGLFGRRVVVAQRARRGPPAGRSVLLRGAFQKPDGLEKVVPPRFTPETLLQRSVISPDLAGHRANSPSRLLVVATIRENELIEQYKGRKRSSTTVCLRQQLSRRPTRSLALRRPESRWGKGGGASPSCLGDPSAGKMARWIVVQWSQ